MRRWTAGVNGAVLRDGEIAFYAEDANGEYAYREHGLAQFIVDALNEKEQRDAGSPAATTYTMPVAVSCTCGAVGPHAHGETGYSSAKDVP